MAIFLRLLCGNLERLLGHADQRIKNIRNPDQKPATSHPSIKQEGKKWRGGPNFLSTADWFACISATICWKKRAKNFAQLFQQAEDTNLRPVARSSGSFSHYQESRHALCTIFPVLPRKAAALYNLYEQKRQSMSSGSDMIKVGFE